MNLISAQADSLIERIYTCVMENGTKTGGDFQVETDTISSRNTSWETRELSEGPHTFVVTQKTKSGTKKQSGADETAGITLDQKTSETYDPTKFMAYRVVKRDFQYLNTETATNVIARHMVAEGNWFPNPYIPETSESSMSLSRATGPAWLIEDDDDEAGTALATLAEIATLLNQRYQKKPA